MYIGRFLNLLNFSWFQGTVQKTQRDISIDFQCSRMKHRFLIVLSVLAPLAMVQILYPDYTKPDDYSDQLITLFAPGPEDPASDLDFDPVVGKKISILASQFEKLMLFVTFKSHHLIS